MKKTIIALVVVGLLLASLAPSVLAFGGGFGSGSRGTGTCIGGTLTEEQQAAFDAVIEPFRADMLELREKMLAAREAGKYELLAELREERNELMEQKRADLSEILPAEYADRFQNGGQGMRKFGAEKGSGGFGSGSCLSR
jgi:Spy/CpxP family protein refolding chaperone